MASSSLSTHQSANLLNQSHRIPPETLTSIFSYTLQSGGRTERTGFLTTEPLEQSKAIVALTHVCRYWRATLLSNPMFWTTANLTNPFMATALLERSGNLPIIAAFMSPDPITPVPSTEVLLPHFSRIQKVHVNAPRKQLVEFLSNLCGHSSILEAVELQCSFAGDQYSGVVDGNGEVADPLGEGFKLPPMLRDALSLKFLRVTQLSFSNRFLVLNHLTHLEVSYDVGEAEDYLALMSANPMLEVVIIHGTGDWELAGIFPRTVSLPHLRRMEFYHMDVLGILRTLISPAGTHLSACACPRGYVIPPSNNLPNISTLTKLQFTFPERGRRPARIVHGYGPNGTFLLTDDLHRLSLGIRDVPVKSVEELSISFTDTVTNGISALNFDNLSLRHTFFPFTRLRMLILQRVGRGELIIRILGYPGICPELHTLVLTKVRPHAAYWRSLVGMARARDQHAGSSNIRRVDISCHPEESPEPDQLVELRAHVFSVEVKPWDYEVEELDWLNDPRFKNLNRL